MLFWHGRYKANSGFYLRVWCVVSGGGLILSGCADGDLRASFAIDVGDGKGPERDEFDSWDKLCGEGRQELPVPAEEVCQQSADAEVDYIVGGRCGAFEDKRKDGDLENVGDDGEDHGDAQARTSGDFDGFAMEVSGRGHGRHQ
jgi:hypothetical protein